MFTRKSFVVPALCAVAVIGAYAPITAARAAAESGIAVPKGGQSVNDSSMAEGFGRLLADGAQLFHLPARSGGPGRAEVYIWSGSNYRPDRLEFTKTILRNALSEAGYTSADVDPTVEDVPNIFDTDRYGLGGLDIQINEGKLHYFHAANAANGKAMVGVWVPQPSQNRLILALAPAGSQAVEVKNNSVPGVTGADTWLVKDLKHATKGMPPAPPVVFPALAAKPGTVRGYVRDGSGKPIVGAHLIAHSSAAGGFRTAYEARTNAQGLYEIALPLGIAQIVNADCRVNFHDDTLLLPLDPADGVRDEFDSRKGQVESFVLRASGSAGPDGGDYGAPMRILSFEAPAGSTTEVTLKPVGTLLDGSKGRTLVFRWKSRPDIMHSSETFLGGIPIGKYTLTAKVYDNGDALPLRAKKTFHTPDEDEPQLESSMTVEFESVKAGNLANPGESGIQRYEVTLRP